MQFIKVGNLIFNAEDVQRFEKEPDSAFIHFRDGVKPVLLGKEEAEGLWNYLQTQSRDVLKKPTGGGSVR